MTERSYHISVHPDRNDSNFQYPKIFQIYIWDAINENEKLSLVPPNSRVFNGDVLPLDTYFFLLSLKLDFYSTYKRINLSNEYAFVSKIFATPAEASRLPFHINYRNIKTSHHEYTAQELSSNTRKILKQEIQWNRGSLFAIEWSIFRKKDLDLIAEYIKTNFLDKRPP